MEEIMIEKKRWFKHAVAFAVRARAEMWGKHNAEVLAFLFQYGFKNRFVKDLLVGWNRRERFREAKTWGLSSGKRVALPEGLVIPYLLDKQLRKLTIVRHTGDFRGPDYVVPGSRPISMVFGAGPLVAVVENILDGLLLHQEMGEGCSVIIPHDLATPPDAHAEKRLQEAERVLFFPDRFSEKITSARHWSPSTADANTHRYHLPAEMVAACRLPG